MGVHHSIACLRREYRLQRMNVMSLTLGPHESNDNEVLEHVGIKLRKMKESLIVDLHGKSSFVSTFVFILAGDFPQQQKTLACC